MVNRGGTAAIPFGVKRVTADVRDVASARRAIAGASVVFHCARVPTTQWVEALPPIMQGLVTAAGHEGAKVVYGDNLWVYGLPDGPLTEDLPSRPLGPLGRVRAMVAEMLLDAHQRGQVRAAIGRASDFYGPSVVQSAVGDLVFGKALERQPARVIGEPSTPHTYTFIDDFARALVTLGEREEALGQVWHVPSAETLTTRRFVENVYEEARVPVMMRTALRWWVLLRGWLSHRQQVLLELLPQLEHPWIVDHSKFERAFGAHPTTHRAAIHLTLEWYSRYMGDRDLLADLIARRAEHPQLG